ncbi:hypothetical protein Dsin_004321 [Dipteronia sinensis]|uniref:Growth-regulating factor n=1 Tax=Dipteronia sinensis TaxID=43782 RepID=A0AAE0BAK0_9ROSI|nr:hypothetical protein Dsin_004321 [Dipteronia sinensis]
MDEGDTRKSDGGGTSDESNLFPCKKKKKMMMVHDHDDHDNHHCPFPSDDCGWRRGGGDVVGGGPTCNNNSRPRTSSSSSSGDVIGGSSVKTLQPFDNIGAAVPQTSFKSPGGGLMAATSMGFFPFTNAQWKELERQAMIYKYMMASLPVPHQLLFPFLINPSPPYVGSDLNVIRFSNGGDPEPGRCRRTDGKKWRCSRDVAPDQKYCERHLHRGRHRSRKPVEQLPPKNNNKKTRLQSDPLPPPSSSVTQSYNHVKSTEKVTVFESVEQQRCLDNWMMNSSVYNQNYQPEPPLNLNCYTDIINPDLVASLENQHQTETPIRGFIDLWSNGVSDHDHNNNTNSGNSSSNGNLLLSPLSLSMGGSSSNNNTTIEDEMGRIQMGLGVIQTDQDHECSTKLPSTSWLPPSSWAPGGPLAEVLRPSTVIQSNPPSPVATVNGDTLSSPSGVLQKTLASSWSDSSGSSSPTFASSNANNKPVELALLWLNQGKLSSSST